MRRVQSRRSRIVKSDAAVEAPGNEFTSTFSGTFVTTALDLDDGDSCTGTPPVCTDLSRLDTIAGKTSGGIAGGQFTGQSVVELEGVPGAGCAIAPTIKGCTLGAEVNACEFQSVGVASKADRYNSTGDILTDIVPPGGETLCVDFSTGNHAGSASGSITGGSGKFARNSATILCLAVVRPGIPERNGSSSLRCESKTFLSRNTLTPSSEKLEDFAVEF